MNTPKDVAERQMLEFMKSRSQINSPDKGSPKNEAAMFGRQLKLSFERSKVPFSPDSRLKSFKPDQSLTTSLYRTAYGWNKPNYDMTE